ncbi:porin [Blattabacterium cuenoti]|uniref:porin n=1 Tax=Blattabacterium cuenoti TaxID=1653831 RepID=UPI00163BE3A1|nr:porin [Blattabacterium cuenoti]
MKKTKIIFLILFLGFFYPFHSFSEIIQQKKTIDENPNFNVFLDYSNSIHFGMKEDISENTHFSENNFNLEVIGKANDKISYCFTKQFVKQIENKNYNMLDVAYLKYKWNDKLDFLFGKQPFSFGSMEYASGPYEHAYRYTHVHKRNKNNNYVGFSFIYHPIKDHELQFQVVNDMKRQEEGNMIIQDINYPMGYSVNWNWGMNPPNNDHDHDHDHDDKIIKNRWSYSIFQEHEKQKYWKLLALGSQFNYTPVTIETDYILSNEDIETNKSISRSWNRDYYYNYDIVSVKYGTYLVKLKYNFLPKWNLIAKGVYEIGSYKKKINNILGPNELFQKIYTYYGGVEFLPIIKNDDISFFIAYQNYRINYNLDQIKKEKNNDHFLILGLNYRVKMI